MWRALLLLSVLALGCEFDAFRSDELCSEETPCITGACIQGLCQPTPEMAIVDAAFDAAPDATPILDALPIDAQPRPDARPPIDMTPVVDARPPMPDQAIVDAFVPDPDMAAPEPDPVPEPLPEPNPEPFGFTGPECGGPEHLCVAVAADATLAYHEPNDPLGRMQTLRLEHDVDAEEYSEILLGFALRPHLLEGADGLELLLPQAGGGAPYDLPVDAIYVSLPWDEETVTANTMLNRRGSAAADGRNIEGFTAFPLDAFLHEVRAGGGRFSIQLRLRREVNRREFHAREAGDEPAARLRFRFDPE